MDVMNVLLLTGAPRSDRIKRFLLEKADSVMEYDKPISVDLCKDQHIDYMVVHGYAPIIKKPVVQAFENRIINLHNTYLPWGRGLMGNVWSFFEDTPKGVSLHFINAGVDTGDLIAREEVALSMKETLQSSWNILMERLERLFMQQWENIVKGQCKLIRQSQISAKGSFHNGKLSKQLLSFFPMGWSTPVSEVYELGQEYRADPAAFETRYNVMLTSKKLQGSLSTCA
jgi:methionyl-tRNA formyltransferase